MESKEVQLGVFAAHPDVDHCELLEHNNRACIGCAKNPREGEQADINDEVEENEGILNFVLDICSLHESGFVVGQSLHPCHAKWVQVGTLWARNQRDERLAKLIGYETGKIVGKMFSGK